MIGCRRILVAASEPQSNELYIIVFYRGPTELVQHFADRGSSHRRNGAARHVFDMVWDILARRS